MCQKVDVAWEDERRAKQQPRNIQRVARRPRKVFDRTLIYLMWFMVELET